MSVPPSPLDWHILILYGSSAMLVLGGTIWLWLDVRGGPRRVLLTMMAVAVVALAYVVGMSVGERLAVRLTAAVVELAR